MSEEQLRPSPDRHPSRMSVAEMLEAARNESPLEEPAARGLTSLSDAAAESLSKHEGDLDLRSLTSLSDGPGHVALAERLRNHEGELVLSGLTSLSDAAAQQLSKHEGHLSLDGLTELSDKTAESLSKHEGTLVLSGLTNLSDAAAEHLSKHEGNLYLDGLTELSDETAESLSKHKGALVLTKSFCRLVRECCQDAQILRDAPAEPSEEEPVAEEPVRTDFMSDKGLLTKEIVEQLIGDEDITLSGIGKVCYSQKSNTTRVKEILADLEASHGVHSVPITGDSITTIGFTAIEDEAAQALIDNEFDEISIGDFTNLSDTAANTLSQHKGYLNLTIKNMSDGAAEALSRFQGRCLCLPEADEGGIIDISHSAASKLLDVKCWGLSLDSTATTDAPDRNEFMMEWLSQHDREEVPSLVICLAQLFHIGADCNFEHDPEWYYSMDADGAALLIRKTCWGGIDLSNIPWLADEIFPILVSQPWADYDANHDNAGSSALDGFFELGLTSLTDIAAESLSNLSVYPTRGEDLTLSLANLRQINEAQADSLSRLGLNHDWFPNLMLNGLQTLSTDAARCLSRLKGGNVGAGPEVKEFMGSLALEGLTDISDEVAEELLSFRGELHINLDNLPASAAQILRDAGHGE